MSQRTRSSLGGPDRCKQITCIYSPLDVFQNVSQPLPLPYHHRLFKYLPAEDPPIWPAAVLDPPTEDSRLCRPSRALRLRFGRGGRLLVDRCDARLRLHASQKSFSRNWNIESGGGRGSPCVDSHVLDESIWKYDLDDVPAASPWAAEEQDRVLIDDFEAKYVHHDSSPLTDISHAH